jgi:hypothetical protein
MYHTLSGSSADGSRGRAGNCNPSTSWMTIGFASITDIAGGKVQVSASVLAFSQIRTTSVKEVHNLVGRDILGNDYNVLGVRSTGNHQDR